MYDFTIFIDSPTLRERYKNDCNELNAFKASTLIRRSRKQPLKKRHEAYQWILDNMLKETTAQERTLQRVLESTILEENHFLKDFCKAQKDKVYIYRTLVLVDNWRTGSHDLLQFSLSRNENGSCFTTYGKCVHSALHESYYRRSPMLHGYEISKLEIDRFEDPEWHGHVYISPEGEVVDLYVPRFAEIDEMWAEVFSF